MWIDEKWVEIGFSRCHTMYVNLNYRLDESIDEHWLQLLDATEKASKVVCRFAKRPTYKR